MKTKLTSIVCSLLLVLAGVANGADEPPQKPQPGPLAVATDAVVVRPLCLASTIIGSALFVVSLPVAAPSHSIKSSAEALITKPANHIFKRQLGDLDSMAD